jgi:hypothetical protein
VSIGHVNGETDDPAAAEERNRARSQALIREVNEHVFAFTTSSVTGDKLLVICECAAVSCSAPVSVTQDEYERVRRSATQFIVKPGHTDGGGERIVDELPEFVVVEKVGEGAEVAIRLDPRRD